MLLTLLSCNPECIGINCAEPHYIPKFEVFFGDNTPEKVLEADLSITHTGEWVDHISLELMPGELLVGSPDESALYKLIGKKDVFWDLSEESPEFSLPEVVSFGKDIQLLNTISEQLLLISAPEASHLETAIDMGSVFVLDSEYNVVSEIRGTINGYLFGDVVSVCADLDGDGWEDWIAAQSYSSTNTDFSGEVVIGLSTIWRASSLLTINDLPRIYGDSVGSRFGGAIDCKTDADDDGITDIFIGAAFQDIEEEIDAAGVIYRLEGIPLSTGTYLINDLNPVTYAGLYDESWLGWALEVANILGDSRPELIAGAPGVNDGSGEILIWRGEELNSDTQTSPRYRIFAPYSNYRLGQEMTTLDMNGDDYLDLLLGAPQQTLLSRLNNGGGSFAFFGTAQSTGWPPIQSLNDANWKYFGSNDKQHTGLLLKAADIDEDGYEEWAIYSDAP